MPKVSVIIPTYNCARYLPAAIESVLRQTYRDFEIIVVNDGSPDDTDTAVAPYLERIIYIKQANLGAPAARNRGLAASTGELIAFLDDDDEWMPEKLELQLPAFDDPRVGLVYSDIRVVHDDGHVIESFLATRPLAASGYIFENFLASGFILTSCVVVSRRCLEDVGHFDESMRSLQDFDLWFRILRRWKAALVRRALALRRLRAGNMTSDRNLPSRFYVRLYEKVLTEFELSPRERAIARSRMAEVCYERGYYLSYRGSQAEARSVLLRSLRYNARQLRAWRCLAATLAPAAIAARLRNSSPTEAERL
ncbi:MAG: glycosyltransferase family 2 protein [Terriglobales bacterium]